MNINKSINPYIIAITGTKGKTTITRLLSHVYTTAGEYTLRVDTDGHYLNDRQQGTSDDSRQLYGLLPATCPGRFLHQLQGHPGATAVLEVSFSSAGTAGLGYLSHDIGVFTNVYADHIGRRITSRAQLAKEKASLIFGRIKPQGTAVFNADDKLICNNLRQIPDELRITSLPVGLNFSHFDLSSHLKKDGNRAITRQGDEIGILTRHGFQPTLNVKDVYWTYQGIYQPSVDNLMLSLATIIARTRTNNIPASIIDSITKYRLPKTGGRLTVLTNKDKDLTVILDYAHEQESLKQISLLAAHLARNKTIGIIRLNPDRTDELIQKTGHFIANTFDIIVVYDKIDNVRRKKLFVNRWNLARKPGDTAAILYQSIKQRQSAKRQVFKEIQEVKAVARAFSLAKPGDCIVHIANDDHRQSLAYVKKYLFPTTKAPPKNKLIR